MRRWCAWFACVSVFFPMWLVLTGFGAFAKVTSCSDRSNRDAIVGTKEPQTLQGTPGDDIILGLGGNDFIRGLSGDDLLCGGRGDDKWGHGSCTCRVYRGPLLRRPVEEA
jgi:RTX calcium-binding nonapeptide repeat (4 copies)